MLIYDFLQTVIKTHHYKHTVLIRINVSDNIKTIDNQSLYFCLKISLGFLLNNQFFSIIKIKVLFLNC